MRFRSSFLELFRADHLSRSAAVTRKVRGRPSAIGHPERLGVGIQASIVALAIANACCQPAHAATGFFGDGTGGAIFYVTDGSTAGEGTYLNVGSLDNTDYGDFIVGTSNLLLRGGEAKTFKNDGGNVTGANQYYRVYSDGGTAPTFSSFALPFGSDLGNGDQLWKKTDQNVNLASGITASGRYVVEYYWDQTGNQGTTFLSDGGNNYQTYFDLFYEIDTAGTVTQATAGGATTLSGDGIFVKKGTGTVQINANNSSYTGNVFVDQGTIEFQAGSVLTSGNITLGPESSTATGNLTISDSDGGTTVNSLITVRLNGDGSSLGATNSTGTNTYSGNISLDGGATTSISSGGTLAFTGTEIDLKTFTLTVDGAGNTSISADLTDSTGSGSLTKNGAGTLTLSGPNSFSGTTTISSGVLRAASNSALGSTAGEATVSSGAALELSGDITIGSEALGLTGTGVSSDGALRNISGANEYQGAITLSGATRINSDAGTLTLSTGGISGTHNLTFGGAGDTTVSGVIGTSTGAVTKDGAGTLTLSGANTYTGKTTVSAGTLALSTGVLLASGEIEVTAAGLLDVSGVTGGFALGAGQTLSGNGSIAGSLSMGTTSRMAFSATTPLTLTSGTLSFAAGTAGSRFGIDNLDGLTSATALGTYTLVSGAVDTTNLDNLNAANAYDLGNGVSAYFQEGSLQVVVVPEPAVGLSAAAALIGIGLVLRRCAAREHQAGADRHPVAA